MRLIYFYIIFLIVTIQIPYRFAKTNNSHKSSVIDNIIDIKDFKKLIRTKTNVLVCFTDGLKQNAIIKTFKDVAVAVKGLGTMVLVDCVADAKKMCKKLKVAPEPYVLKHYKDGDFNKDYDRLETVASMVNFMRDPGGDIPWEEDSSAVNVYHISDANSLAKFLKRESKPILVMFYAPWCGFCKTLKPEYSQAADELMGQSVLAAIDVNRPENSVIRTQYNITGFPTLLYYENGELKYTYDGENTRAALVHFMRHPAPSAGGGSGGKHRPQQHPPPLTTEPDWSELDSEVVHLTSASFEPALKEESSVLVMFYAPWCGHCKRMKPEYEEAAAQLKSNGITGMLAAVDCTRDPPLAARFAIRGYPTVKYFAYGEERYDVTARSAPQLVAFMRNPSEAPPAPPPEVPWAEQHDRVVHLDEATFRPFLKKKKHVLVMFYTPWCGHCKKAKPEFSKAAERFKDDTKVEFAAVDCTTQQGLCNANDIKGYPTIRYFSYYSKSTKNFSGSRTEADFVRFMSDPDSSGKPPAPSAPASSEWKLASVLQLTDNDFNTHIQTDTPVLVMFYAPWCGHCKRFKPEYAKTAQILNEEGIAAKLAIIDCTENPIVAEKYEINGFPTIKLFKNGKFVTDYKGKRNLDDLKEFMKQAKNLGKDEL